MVPSDPICFGAMPKGSETPRKRQERSIAATAVALGLAMGLAACNPYDPGQRAVAGGLYGAAMGAAIGAAATGGPGAPLGAAAGGAAGLLFGAATPPIGFYGYSGYGYGGYAGEATYPGYSGYGYPGYPAQMGTAAATVATLPRASQICRTFRGDATVDSSQQPYYGTACLEADGRWHIVP
jgi:hypothetical protein